MTEEQYAIAWMQLAKEERKRAMQRDGKLQFLKQNMSMDYLAGGRDMKPETRQIIEMAKQGKELETIFKTMAFKGMTKNSVQRVLSRHKEKWFREASRS